MEPIAEYLEDLRQELRCGRRRKQAILAETNDHLRESAATIAAQEGRSAPEAEGLAIDRFGPSVLVAQRLSRGPDVWVMLSWYVHLGIFVGLVVFAYGLAWLMLSSLTWALEDDPHERLAAIQAAMLGLAMVGAHLLAGRMVLDPTDTARPAQILRTWGGGLLALTGILLLVGAVAEFRNDPSFSASAIQSANLTYGPAFLVVAGGLLALAGPLRIGKAEPR